MSKTPPIELKLSKGADTTKVAEALQKAADSAPMIREQEENRKKK